MTTRADREPLTGIDGHDLLAAHANRHGITLITKQRRGWSWPLRDHDGDEGGKRPGGRLIAAAAVLLFVLGIGLLAVSYAAQYRYVLNQRHQDVASLIEAGALDVGLIIFSLLALGLARAGLAAKTERALIVVCAAGSALMNYAAADVTSPRSVLAYCMPPVFLAVVADRVVVVIRRHMLGMREGRSPWRVPGLVALFGLRFALALPSTCSGVRRAILAATPLPEVPAEPKAIDPPKDRKPDPDRRRREPAGRSGTMTARFLELARERYGDFSQIDPARVSPICTELAPEIGMDPGNARTALRKAVLAAQAAGEGDAR